MPSAAALVVANMGVDEETLRTLESLGHVGD
jgi:hypothetical protein